MAEYNDYLDACTNILHWLRNRRSCSTAELEAELIGYSSDDIENILAILEEDKHIEVAVNFFSISRSGRIFSLKGAYSPVTNKMYEEIEMVEKNGILVPASTIKKASLKQTELINR